MSLTVLPSVTSNELFLFVCLFVIPGFISAKHTNHFFLHK